MAVLPFAATSAAKLWSPHGIAVEVDGPEGRLNIVVDKPFARVGRDQRAEVPLSDGGLFPCHLYLHATDEGVYHVGLAPDASSGWLSPSESIQVGPFQLRARLADRTPDQPLPEDLQAKQRDQSLVPQLRVFFGGRQARSTDMRLRRRLTLLGRELPATRRVTHPSVSRVHGAMFFDGRELWLVDLFSSNGTRLAGKKFDSGPVLPGQELHLGSVRFRYLGAEANRGTETEGLALEQPVKIMDHSDEPASHGSESRFPTGEEPELALAEALRQQNSRLEQERDELQHQLDRGLAAIREELVKEVGALRQESAIAGQAFQNLSGEVATTREALFALYGEVGPKSADAGVAARANDQRAQIAAALQEAERRWTELAQDLTRRTLELGQQIAESQEAHKALAGSMKLERQQTARRLRKERRASRGRMAAEKRKLAPEIAALQEQVQAVRQDLRSLETTIARTEPTASAGQVDIAESHAPPLAEAVKREEEALLLAEARWKELADGFGRREGELTQQVADCRRADAQMAENFKAALGEMVRHFQAREQAHSQEVAALKSALLAESTGLREQIAMLRSEIERNAAELSPLKPTLAAMRPTLTRFESGEWLADLQEGWNAHLQGAIDEVHQRIADFDRQSSLDRQAGNDRIAVLEGALTAKIADLRAGLDLLREMAEEQRSELRATATARQMLGGQTDPPPEVGQPSPPQEQAEVKLAPRHRTIGDANLGQTMVKAADSEGAPPPAWVINDGVTQRLLDFKNSREHTARRRLLLWTAVAAGLAAIIVTGAGFLHLWWNGGEDLKQNEAASLEQSRPLKR